MKALQIEPERPFEYVDLGPAKLLGFTVTKAAEYFGIEAPITKRDRKSGAKKRKQQDIEIERLLLLRVANG